MLIDVAWKRSENDLQRERQTLSLTFSAYCCLFSGDFNLLCPLSWKRERGTVSWVPHAILGTKVSNFMKCKSSLMYCQLYTSVSLSLQRQKSHLIQFDNITGSWFEKCSSHPSKDTHSTHTWTHNTLFASLVYGLPEAPPFPINFIGS